MPRVSTLGNPISPPLAIFMGKGQVEEEGISSASIQSSEIDTTSMYTLSGDGAVAVPMTRHGRTR